MKKLFTLFVVVTLSLLANASFAANQCEDALGAATSCPVPVGAGARCEGDGDNVAGAIDNCQYVANQDQSDFDLDGIGDACDDSDGDCIYDGVVDGEDEGDADNCELPNFDQKDDDGDGLGNKCEDTDADDIDDGLDNCPEVHNPKQSDFDGDGFGDGCDNCPAVANNQDDLDDNGLGNGFGDACELDYDGDRIPDNRDNCPSVANGDQMDSDHDGKGNKCDIAAPVNSFPINPGGSITPPRTSSNGGCSLTRFDNTFSGNAWISLFAMLSLGLTVAAERVMTRKKK